MSEAILVVSLEDSMGPLGEELEELGFALVQIHSRRGAIETLQAGSEFAVALLETTGDDAGLEAVRGLRVRGNNIPVIVLGKSAGIDDVIEAFDAGCDDFLAKPFALAELAARIRAIRRRTLLPRPSLLTYQDLALNLHSRVATRSGRRIPLTNREYRILKCLMQDAEHPITRRTLLHEAWGPDRRILSNVLEVYINALRRKIDEVSDPPLLHTVRGTGYILQLGFGSEPIAECQSVVGLTANS